MQALHEQQRRHYLQALALPQFVHKQTVVVPAESVTALTPVVGEVFVVQPAPRPAPLSPPRPELAAQLMPSAPAPAIAAPAPTASAELRFSCCLYRLADDRLVLIDTHAAQDLSAAELQLWQSLCLAMHWQAHSEQARFDWPFSYAKHLAQDTKAAQEALNAWWQSRSDVVSSVLVLGEALAAHVPSASLVLPSLAAMLQTPLLKKHAWQCLQP